MTVLERLRGLREDRDLKQKDMANLLKVSQSTYSDYELEKLNIPLNTLKRLAVFFDTSVDYMLDLTDEARPYPRKKKKL